MRELRESREAARKKTLWSLWTWISLSCRRQLPNASIWRKEIAENTVKMPQIIEEYKTRMREIRAKRREENEMSRLQAIQAQRLGYNTRPDIRELCWQYREKLQTIRRKRRRQNNRKWRRRVSLQLVTGWLTRKWGEIFPERFKCPSVSIQLSKVQAVLPTLQLQACVAGVNGKGVKEVKNAPFPPPLLRFSLATAVNRNDVWDWTRKISRWCPTLERSVQCLWLVVTCTKIQNCESTNMRRCTDFYIATSPCRIEFLIL